MSESEVAKIRQEIEETCVAMRRGLEGFARVGRHEYIFQKYQQLGRHHERLKDLVGEKQAIETVVEIYNRTVI